MKAAAAAAGGGGGAGNAAAAESAQGAENFRRGKCGKHDAINLPLWRMVYTPIIIRPISGEFGDG